MQITNTGTPQSTQDSATKEHMIPGWVLNKDLPKSPNNHSQDMKRPKEKWESETQRREDEEDLPKLPSVHLLLDETASVAPPSPGLSPHNYPPYKSSQPFHLVPPSKSSSHSSHYRPHESHFDSLSQKEISELHSFRQHDSHRASYPFDSSPSIRDPYGRLSPPLSSARFPPPYHPHQPPSHLHAPSPLLDLLDPREFPPKASPTTSPPSANYYLGSGSRRSDLSHHGPTEYRSHSSDSRNYSDSRNSDYRNSREPWNQHSDSPRLSNTAPTFKNTDVWVSSKYSSSSAEPYPYKFHHSHEVPPIPDYPRNEKLQAVPGTPSPQHTSFPPPHFSSLSRPPSKSPLASHPHPHSPSLSPSSTSSSSSSSSSSSTQQTTTSSSSSSNAPTYGEFEENEYNLRIKSPANPVPTLSPEQKRRRRIINKALSKGQMIARAQAQADAHAKIREGGAAEAPMEPVRRKRHHVTQPPHVSRRCPVSLVEDKSKFICNCDNSTSGTAVECDLCEKWYHTECTENADSTDFVCTTCKSENRKRARSDSDGVKETSESTDPVDLSELIDEEETGGIRVGNEVVSLSTLAKQPWIDGWATARILAVQYLQEAKKMGNEITESRKLPKQIAVRMSTKGKRPWRQAEVLLAIQFLKTSELVETSTRKGTLVKEPYKTMDDLIARALSVPMPTAVHKSRS